MVPEALQKPVPAWGQTVHAGRPGGETEAGHWMSICVSFPFSGPELSWLTWLPAGSRSHPCSGWEDLRHACSWRGRAGQEEGALFKEG